MANIPEISDASFQAEVLSAAKPVLVDFWAPWCGPCRMIAPVLEQLAGENGDAVRIVKVNVDESPTTAQGYDISAIPTLILFKDGQVVDRFVGPQPKSRLQEAINQAAGS
ncbi:MAG: thioredoxin [Thermoguttaceae bacterium]|jgi:thioredoxin 1